MCFDILIFSSLSKMFGVTESEANTSADLNIEVVLLNEKVIFLQWVGIVFIILAIIIMNINFKTKT